MEQLRKRLKQPERLKGDEYIGRGRRNRSPERGERLKQLLWWRIITKENRKLEEDMFVGVTEERITGRRKDGKLQYHR